MKHLPIGAGHGEKVSVTTCAINEWNVEYSEGATGCSAVVPCTFPLPRPPNLDL